MTIYVARNFGTFGKDIPTVPNQRFVGGVSRGGAIIRAVQTGFHYVRKYHKGLTKAGSLVAGAGITGVGENINETNDSLNQALRPVYSVHRYNRNRNRTNTRKQCCCHQQRHINRG